MTKAGSYNVIDAIYAASEAEPRRRNINSVEIGIRVLEALMNLGQPSTLKAIATATDLDASQAHRYVSSLVNCGVVLQDRTTGLYDLGPKALHIGLTAMNRLDPVLFAEEKLKQFSIDTGSTCLMSVWGPNGPVVIRWFHGRPPVFTILTLGSVLPVFNSATGRVFASFLDAHFIEPYLAADGWDAPLEKNKELADWKEETLKSGLGKVSSTVVPGLQARAAPVFGIQRSVICVATILYPDTVDFRQECKTHEVALLDACKSISKDIGGQWPINSPAGKQA